MATDAETVVRHAYHFAEGSVLDTQGFIDSFTEDGVFNTMGGESYRGEHLADVLLKLASVAPDVHREFHQFHVMGDVIVAELSIQGTFTKPFETPAGVIQPTGGKLDIPCADVWYTENGKVKVFNCYASTAVMLAQLGVQPKYAGGVAASAAAAD